MNEIGIIRKCLEYQNILESQKLTEQQYRNLVIADIVIPIPQIRRDFDREGEEYVAMPMKGGNYLRTAASDLEWLYQYTNENTKWTLGDSGYVSKTIGGNE